MMGVRSMEAEALVLMLRPLVVDLLEASGLTHDEAASMLVPLGDSITEHAPKTSAIPTQRPDSSDKHRADTRQLTAVLRSKDRGPATAGVPQQQPSEAPAVTSRTAYAERVEKQRQLNTAQLTIIEEEFSSQKR